MRGADAASIAPKELFNAIYISVVTHEPWAKGD